MSSRNRVTVSTLVAICSRNVAMTDSNAGESDFVRRPQLRPETQIELIEYGRWPELAQAPSVPGNAGGGARTTRAREGMT